MTDIELAQIAAGTVTLHDARRKMRWSVDLEPFEIGGLPGHAGGARRDDR